MLRIQLSTKELMKFIGYSLFALAFSFIVLQLCGYSIHKDLVQPLEPAAQIETSHDRDIREARLHLQACREGSLDSNDVFGTSTPVIVGQVTPEEIGTTKKELGILDRRYFREITRKALIECRGGNFERVHLLRYEVRFDGIRDMEHFAPEEIGASPAEIRQLVHPFIVEDAREQLGRVRRAYQKHELSPYDIMDLEMLMEDGNVSPREIGTNRWAIAWLKHQAWLSEAQLATKMARSDPLPIVRLNSAHSVIWMIDQDYIQPDELGLTTQNLNEFRKMARDR